MQWYYIVGSERLGPVDGDQLQAMIRQGKLGPDDLVWNETMGQEWRAVRNVPELAPLVLTTDAQAAGGAGQPQRMDALHAPIEPGAISCTGPVTPAWERMKDILFRPFNIGKWFMLGFSAWLATLGQGGGNFNATGPADWNEGSGGSTGDFQQGWETFRAFLAEHSWVLPVIGIGILLFFAIGVALLWLRCRGRFMFLDNVVNNRGDIAYPWRAFKQHANSLFLWSFVFGMICLIVAIALIALTGITVVLPCIRAGRFLPSVFPGIILLGVLWLLFILATGLVAKFLEDFVVPIMYMHDLTATEAWKRFLPLLRRNTGRFILYLLFYFVLGLAAALIVGLMVLATCCIAGCLMALPWVGAVILLPVTVFFRLYSLEYLAQYGPDFQMRADA
jgi:hypothetical protein